MSSDELGARDPKTKKSIFLVLEFRVVRCDHTIAIVSTLIKEAQARCPKYSTGVRELEILSRVPVDNKEV